MTVQFLGPDPLEREIRRVISALANGDVRGLESRSVDLKEEAGRRTREGDLRPGRAKNDQAAEHLVGECACLANTPGAGAIILGAADDGRLLGTDLAEEWLRHRLYELSERALTVDVRVVVVNGVRLLVLKMPEALEPVRHRSRINWRVADNCVEVDTASWWSGRLSRLGHDWSAQPSAYLPIDARATALQRARDLLRASNEDAALELAQANTMDFLRRLDVVTDSTRLTNAGALVFIGRTEPAVDYIRRDVPGGDSVVRIRDGGLSLLEELHDVEQAISASNPAMHIASGLSAGQIRQLPIAVVREAIVNGVAHRDWQTAAPTTVEHVGASLVVTSPGGFIGGVTPANIITHPSQPRNRALAELLSRLKIAEREGIGVDRMVRDMLRIGGDPPEIVEVDGPHVRAAIVGGRVDEDWVRFLSKLDPASSGSDLDCLLLLHHLMIRGWVDVPRAAPVLQRTDTESLAAIQKLTAVAFDGAPVLVPVAGTPLIEEPAWRLSNEARDRLRDRTTGLTGPAGRAGVAMDWAHARGRVSSTELGDIADVAVNHAGATLKSLVGEGALGPGRGTRTGRGFFYVPTDGPGRHRKD